VGPSLASSVARVVYLLLLCCVLSPNYGNDCSGAICGTLPSQRFPSFINSLCTNAVPVTVITNLRDNSNSWLCPLLLTFITSMATFYRVFLHHFCFLSQCPWVEKEEEEEDEEKKRMIIMVKTWNVLQSGSRQFERLAGGSIWPAALLVFFSIDGFPWAVLHWRHLSVVSVTCRFIL